MEKRNNSKTELEIRATFVNQLAGKPEKETDQSKKAPAPVACVLIEGGTRAIDEFSSSLTEKIPCIIVSGTGRAADFLEATKILYERDANNLRLKEKVKKLFGRFLPDESEKNCNFSDTALDCLEAKSENLNDYMRICKIDSVELDKSILELLYLQKQNNFNQIKQALKLSLSWDRAEIFGKIIRQDRQVNFFFILCSPSFKKKDDCCNNGANR